MMRGWMVLVAAMIAGPAWAQDVSAVRVTQPVLVAASTAQRPTALFMTIDNTSSQDLSLVAVTTPACGRTELHDHLHEDGVMRMRQVDRVTVPAQGQVVLKPMGLHVMCFDPVLPQTVGEAVDLTLAFDGAPDVAVVGQMVSFKQVMAPASHH
jgi:periplasmic copper chaperone A